MKRYEAMFLFDNAVGLDWSAVEQEVRRLCGRIGAELHVCVKFDERKLAYEINGRKRGTYVLTYFDATPERIGELERDARLSEAILRLLVLRNDRISAERLAELKAWSPDKPLAPQGDGRREERGEGRGAPREQPRPEAADLGFAEAPEGPKPQDENADESEGRAGQHRAPRRRRE